jgi:hypothetical protein
MKLSYLGLISFIFLVVYLFMQLFSCHQIGSSNQTAPHVDVASPENAEVIHLQNEGD